MIRRFEAEADRFGIRDDKNNTGDDDIEIPTDLIVGCKLFARLTSTIRGKC